jgi:hypothetical protein
MTAKCPPTAKSVLVNSDSVDRWSSNIMPRDRDCQNSNLQLTETTAKEFQATFSVLSKIYIL